MKSPLIERDDIASALAEIAAGKMVGRDMWDLSALDESAARYHASVAIDFTMKEHGSRIAVDLADAEAWRDFLGSLVESIAVALATVTVAARRTEIHCMQQLN